MTDQKLTDAKLIEAVTLKLGWKRLIHAVDKIEVWMSDQGDMLRSDELPSVDAALNVIEEYNYILHRNGKKYSVYLYDKETRHRLCGLINATSLPRAILEAFVEA